MDQVQKIIQKDNPAKYYSLRMLKVARAKKTLARTDEIMIQAYDISARVQSQFMKLEREYLSLMNSTVSHEMRNPLNAIVSQIAAQERQLQELSSLVRQEQAVPKQGRVTQIIEELQTGLTIAKASAKLLRFNVEDILALPQLKQGRFTKNFSRVNLRETVAEVGKIMDFQAREKGVAVTTEFQGFLEDSEGAILISIDEQRFQQVFLNYLSNALKFTEQDGHILVLLQYIPSSDIAETSDPFAEFEARTAAFWEGQVTENSERFCSEAPSEASSQSETRMTDAEVRQYLRLQREATKINFTKVRSPKVVVSVIDTGVGIKAEEQTHLFKLFGTIKRTRAVNTKGVGLGLSISKMICEEFGGTVGLMSSAGVGSAFVGSFVLDKEIEDEQPFQFVAPKYPFPPSTSEGRPATIGLKKNADSLIYVVDDEAYNCEVLKAMILQAGVPAEKIKIFMSGTQALKSIHKNLSSDEPEVGVVLTDLSMPIMDGYKLIDRIKKQYAASGKAAPTIAALTGHTESEFIQKAFAKGADQVFSKPISYEQVEMVLLEAGLLE